MSEITFKYSKKSVSAAELNAALTNWKESVPAPTMNDIPKNELPKDIKIESVRLNSALINKIHEVHVSDNPVGEAVIGQRIRPEEFLGILHSTLTTLSYVKLEGEYNKLLGEAKTENAKKELRDQWDTVNKAAAAIYSSAGLKNVNPKDLESFAHDLAKNEKAFNSIVNIANTGVTVKGAKQGDLDAKTISKGSFIPQLAKLVDKTNGSFALPKNLCQTPFAQGSFTKHFSYSFVLRVSLTVWCPTFWHPFRTCDVTYDIAGASLNVDLNVGYRVTCCGGQAWGSASVNACVSVLGIQFCAGCNASLVGAIGISRAGSGSNCTYGLGLTAELRCTFAGVTVFFIRVPFGYTLTGPCPSPLIPC